MFYDVYILGEPGADPVPAMLAKPIRGDLVIRKRFYQRPDQQLLALLSDEANPGREALQMHQVRIVGMSSDSMVIEGTVGFPEKKSQKSSVHYLRQRWLCKVPGSKVVIDAEVLRRRKTDLAKAMAADPFHPAFDDPPDERTYGSLDDSIG